MNKSYRETSIHRWEHHFIGLLTPHFALAEGIVEGFAALRRGLARRFDAWERKRKIALTVRELSKLEDHVLKDIGVHRSEIYAAARSVVDHPGGDHRDFVWR